MKYLVFWEFCPENMDKVFKKFGEYMTEHEKNPGKYQDYLYPPHFTDRQKALASWRGRLNK